MCSWSSGVSSSRKLGPAAFRNLVHFPMKAIGASSVGDSFATFRRRDRRGVTSLDAAVLTLETVSVEGGRGLPSSNPCHSHPRMAFDMSGRAQRMFGTCESDLGRRSDAGVLRGVWNVEVGEPFSKNSLQVTGKPASETAKMLEN